ncbi:hypothetical protein PO903_15700 [Paenibacillus sp. PK4536]|uniref:hypothetical protein n=1 Tax=Paenibacillus sp. PK4536 TaxID=3024576 RepID=UPI002358F8F5|nr:hypothetical protein [Paenibacillus sp. PK4536]WIM38090.1 hypothetical protein PO903_15700 [Paenibacillus sp. PK4536]
MFKTMMGIFGAGAASLILLTSGSMTQTSGTVTAEAATVTQSVYADTYTPTANVPADGTYTVFINKIERDTNASHYELTVDPINWYTGEAANVEFNKENPNSGIDGAPDGYYITNEDTKTYHYAVAANPKVLMQIYDHTGQWQDIDTNWDEPVSIQKLNAIFQKPDLLDPTSFPYHITVKDGQVTKIVQQFIP